jgi:hypothetical protein
VQKPAGLACELEQVAGGAVQRCGVAGRERGAREDHAMWAAM